MFLFPLHGCLKLLQNFRKDSLWSELAIEWLVVGVESKAPPPLRKCISLIEVRLGCWSSTSQALGAWVVLS